MICTGTPSVYHLAVSKLCVLSGSRIMPVNVVTKGTCSTCSPRWNQCIESNGCLFSASGHGKVPSSLCKRVLFLLNEAKVRCVHIRSQIPSEVLPLACPSSLSMVLGNSPGFPSFVGSSRVTEGEVLMSHRMEGYQPDTTVSHKLSYNSFSNHNNKKIYILRT